MTCDDLYIGQVVAVLYTDRLWYRARIASFPGRRLIHVFYIDYGTSNDVDIDRLRHLHATFTRYPVQAYRGRIDGVRPLNGIKWPPEAAKRLLQLAKGSKPLAAQLTKKEPIFISSNEVVLVHVLNLIDTSTELDVSFALLLIEERLAVAEYEEEDEADVVVGGGGAGEGGGAKEDDEDSIPELTYHPVAYSNGVDQQWSPPSPTANRLKRSPSPQPTCPFPVLLQQRKHQIPSDYEHVKSLDRLTGLFPETNRSVAPSPVHPVVKTVNSAPATRQEPLHTSAKRRHIKPVDLPGGRRLHIFKLESVLYLSGFELAALIPQFQTEEKMTSDMEQMDLKVDSLVIRDHSFATVFIECVT